ncbi:hypothetical protein CANINC_004921 [Pichia inconspicua]|uniref:Uncharacterized protein n=1 Tax=Pichia inconspicua TaxID=52247 RepID=A0A4T0WUV8_9ASCO|nr:hypothetical protein CANINC_004921 [[Candida] inconspicua]
MTRSGRTTPATATFKKTSFSHPTTSKYHSSLFTSTSKGTSSSYTFTPTIPSVKNPYIIHHEGKNGSIFIILGSVIIALIVGMILARFWFWMKNRKATNDEKLLDEYYGGTLEKSRSGFLNYDPAYFDNEKSAFNLSFNSSPYTCNSQTSQSSTSSGDRKSRIDLNNLTTQPGRALRGDSQIPTIRRNSFISPLNDLINESNVNLVSNANSDINSGVFSASTETMLGSGTVLHARNKSIPALDKINSPTPDRRRSTHLETVEQMVNQSLINLDKSGNSIPNEQSTKTKRSRPASQVLDMLVLQDLKDL